VGGKKIRSTHTVSKLRIELKENSSLNGMAVSKPDMGEFLKIIVCLLKNDLRISF
jgi:hypothetical protein